MLADSKDIEIKYSGTRDMLATEDELLDLLKNLINGEAVCMDEFIEKDKCEMVALCLLWGSAIKFEHLKALLKKESVPLSLLLYMLKRSPQISAEERDELRKLLEEHGDLTVAEELLEEQDDSEDDLQQQDLSNPSPSKSKRKALKEGLKEGLKHQLSKLAPN